MINHPILGVGQLDTENQNGIHVHVHVEPAFWEISRKFSKGLTILWLSCTRPGKRLHNELENHHFQWVNPLFRLGHFQ
jgi:hypothetical protein